MFYDAGDYLRGWRYLEAAPVATEFQAAWATSESIGDLGTQTEVGTGKENTQLIVAALNSAGETESAAQRCISLSFGEYTDWFLPSIDELNLMYARLKLADKGGFQNDWYWSSSQYNAEAFARIYNFSDGTNGHSPKSYTGNYVRAIRAF